jgi:Flp pilus assembly protein TadG
VPANLKESTTDADGDKVTSRPRRLGLRRPEQGAVFLEFALVLPLLMSLVLGIFTGGAAYTNKIGLVEAVREGARYGASLPMGTGTDALTTWKDRVRNRVVDASGGDVAAGDVCVEFVLPTGGTICGLADPAGASNEPSVHLVKVSATRGAKMEFFFFTKNTTMLGKLVARYERDTG